METNPKEQTLLRTPLHALHQKYKAKMVPFCGYHMPVSYPLGVLKEHIHTRANAGLFDVSHMGQLLIHGRGVAEALEVILPLDLSGMAIGQQTYTVLLNDQGGILDDLIVTRWDLDKYFLVVNAACKAKDIAWLKEKLPEDIEFDELSDRALLALQGPKAVDVLRELTRDIEALRFMRGCFTHLNGVDSYVTRSGYTGEDGFEISVPAEHAEALAETLLANNDVEFIGLGARDSLRLEAGLCLYGQDMDETTTPVDAGLMFAISKVRRAAGEKAGHFPGASILFEQIENGVEKKRVGIEVQGRAPVRPGTVLQNADGEEIGKVTSGGFGPSINKPVAMAYVKTAFASVDTELLAVVRGKTHPVKIVKTPFVPQRYFRG